MVFWVSYPRNKSSVPLHMGQWMTKYINNIITNKSDHLSINPINYLMTTIYGASLPHPCLVTQIIDKPRIHAFGMDSGLVGSSTPWTPGGYIPVANMLFIPVSNILFIPVSNTFFIPVPNMAFIPVSNMLFIPVPNMLFIPVSNSLLSQSAIYLLSQSATHPFKFHHVYIM